MEKNFGEDGRINVHIQTRKDAPQVFLMTEALWKEALSRHPDLKSKIKYTLSKANTAEVSKWTSKSLEQFKKGIAKAHVLVGYRFPKEELGSLSPDLKYIHIIGAGIEHLLPLDWLPKGTTLVNNRGVHAPKTREYAMLAILMLGSGMPQLFTAQRQNQWNQLFSTIVSGKTIVVIGMGEQGRAVAISAKSLGLKVIGVDINPQPYEHCDKMVKPQKLRNILPLADFVGITVPLTKSTRNMIGKKEMDMMKRTAGLFNIARAQVVDYRALLQKLKRRELAGAVLDVFDPEPLPADSPLWSVPNLIITPHVGCDDLENYIPRTFDLVLNNIRRFIGGLPLLNTIDQKLGF